MTSNITEREIKNSLKYLREKEGIYFIKYPDSVRKYYKSPYDFLILTEACNYALEAKKTKRKSLPFKNITEHQLESLISFSKKLKKNKSFVFVNFRNGKRRADEKINEAYLIDIDKFMEVRNALQRKSLPIQWCRENAVQLKRKRFKKRYGWDLSSLLKPDLLS